MSGPRVGINKRVADKLFDDGVIDESDYVRAVDWAKRRNARIEEAFIESYRDGSFQYVLIAADTNSAAHSRFLESLNGFRQRYSVRGFDPVDARDLVDERRRDAPVRGHGDGRVLGRVPRLSRAAAEAGGSAAPGGSGSISWVLSFGFWVLGWEGAGELPGSRPGDP